MRLTPYGARLDRSAEISALIDSVMVGKKSKTHAPATETIRISPVFGEYVTHNSGFHDELRDLEALIVDYSSRTKVKRPLNILLASEPGSGKSFLLKQLANSVKQRDTDVKFEEFHVAAFRSIEDLYKAFQGVQSANLSSSLPFVLFDEVDGTIQGSHVLANFLAPMWDGMYYAGKDSFAIGKAIFAFAASKMITSPSVNEVMKNSPRKSYMSYHYCPVYFDVISVC